ncbi:MAG TPA: trypsin-like serine protease [Labilithrix sp.]
MRRLAPVLSLLLVVACGGGGETADAQDDAIVGGTRDARASAAGYLVHAASADGLAGAKVACGATLIAPNVAVTAAHCVYAAAHDVWAFGAGDLGAGKLTRVASQHIHPEFHPAPAGTFDVHYYLRNNDVAYLLLERDVTGVVPATLPDAAPAMGCGYAASGYHDGQHVRAKACLGLEVTLGDDPIFEVHPADSSALCVRDGDDGSPLVSDGTGGVVLVGFYVGSVTQGLTDCVKGTQFLDGYESAFGFRAFCREGIALGAANRVQH